MRSDAGAVHDPGVESILERAVADRGFVDTTPIQSAVFPGVLDGADLVACAQTGTGKTLAFLLPLMHRLLDAIRPERAAPAPTRVLVLAPTRELAVQIEDEFQGLAYHTNLSSVAVYGGVEAGPQERGLRGAADIVVATPGDCSITWAAMPRTSRGSKCSCSTRPIGCSTWDSGRACGASWRRSRRSDRRCCFRPQCRKK